MFGTKCKSFYYANISHYREGLDWIEIDWNDNGECLDLVEKVRLCPDYTFEYCFSQNLE